MSGSPYADVSVDHQMKKNKIIYWTTACLEPDIEAVSKEVAALASHFSPALIFSVNPHIKFKVSYRNRWIGFNPAFYPMLRLLIPFIELWGDVNHVYGEISPWIYHKALRKRSILTVASEKGALIPEFVRACTHVTVQTEQMAERLIRAGVDRKKVRLIYPMVAVDLDTTEAKHLSPPTPERVKILFATAPRTREELKARGVLLMLETAAANPGFHFTFLFRKWATGYTSLEETQDLIRKKGVGNIRVLNENVTDMGAFYRSHHFTIAPYTTSDGGKECPNSLLESLAWGTPVLLSAASPFRRFVNTNGCGVTFEPDVNGLTDAVTDGITVWEFLKSKSDIAVSELCSKEKVVKEFMSVYN